jgi:hypothetical protein
MSIGKHQLHTAATVSADGTTMDVAGAAVAALTLSGTWAGTVYFEAIDEAGTWQAINGTKLGGVTAASSATANGLYRFAVSGLTKLRARLTWSSGSLSVVGRASSAPIQFENAESGANTATEAKQDAAITQETAINTILGTVTASPVSNTIADRLKQLLTGIVLNTGSNVIGAVTQSGNWALAAGSALIGKVGIDQTTPFTTNAVGIVGRITKTDRSGTVTTGATAQTLMPANSARLGWQLQNNSVGDIWFNELGATAVANQPSFKLAPGDSYESPVGATTTAAISIIGATTGQPFTAREW